MTTNSERTAKPAVAVFGATGHTGRFVVAELLSRGIVPIAIARDLAALTAANFPGHEARGHETGAREILRRKASIDDVESLDQALDGAQAVINCAGPFLETADAVAAAALRAGIHYLDVTAEQPSARSDARQIRYRRARSRHRCRSCDGVLWRLRRSTGHRRAG